MGLLNYGSVLWTSILTVFFWWNPLNIPEFVRQPTHFQNFDATNLPLLFRKKCPIISVAFVFFKTYVIDETLQRVQFGIGVLGLQASSRRQPKKITKPEIPKTSVQIFFKTNYWKIWWYSSTYVEPYGHHRLEPFPGYFKQLSSTIFPRQLSRNKQHKSVVWKTNLFVSQILIHCELNRLINGRLSLPIFLDSTFILIFFAWKMAFLLRLTLKGVACRKKKFWTKVKVTFESLLTAEFWYEMPATPTILLGVIGYFPFFSLICAFLYKNFGQNFDLNAFCSKSSLWLPMDHHWTIAVQRWEP